MSEVLRPMKSLNVFDMSAQEGEERKFAEGIVVQFLEALYRKNNYPGMCGVPEEKRIKCEKQPEPAKQLEPLCTQSTSKPPALKYLLSPQLRGQEFYECTECGEKRDQNSFFCDHSHGVKKPSIKWFCPLCQKRFSTSYRSGHLMKAHPDSVVRTANKRPRPEEQEEEESVKRTRIEEEIEKNDASNPEGSGKCASNFETCSATSQDEESEQVKLS